MGIYIFVAFFLFMLNRCNKKACVFIAFLLLFSIHAFRDLSVGTDTMNYLTQFSNMEAGSVNIKRIEFIWNILLFVCVFYFESYRMLIVISSFLMFIPLYFVAFKCKKPVEVFLFFVLLYFFFNSMNITRQAIAMTWVLFAYTYYSKRTIIYCALVIFASMFHSSALIMILLPFVSKGCWRTYSVIFTLVITYFVGALKMIRPLLNIIDLIPFFPSYTERVSFDGDSFSFARLLLNLFTIYIVNFYKCENEYIKALVLGVVIFNIFGASPHIARLAQYMIIFQLVFFSNISNKSVPKQGIWIYSVCVFFYFLEKNVAEVVPYHFSFNSLPDY